MQRFAFLLCLLFANQAYSRTQQQIKVAAYDLNPYVSRDRSEHGYLYEIILQSLARAGYSVEIEFFPPNRAKKQVESGAFDLLMPSYASPTDSESLVFSQPIHGSQVGYIQLVNAKTPGKREKLEVRQAFEEAFAQGGALGERGVNSDALFGEEEGVIKSSSDRIVRLVDMLTSGRIRLAIADKFQVTDVLVNRRPSLIGKLKFVVPALASKDFHVAISKKNKDYLTILADFNRGLQALQQTGEYERILLRYGYQIGSSDANTLAVGTVPNADMEVMQDLASHYLAAHPGVKIKWFTLEENLLRRAILSSLALNENIFDVVTIGNYDSPLYAANDWIEPLHPPKSYNADDLLRPIRDTLSYEGRLHALPFYGESSMTYYRKDLFAKAGLKMPEQPTYAQIRDYAEKLHDPSKGIYGICLRGKPGWGENMTYFNTVLNTYGGHWFDLKTREPSLQSKAWKEAVSYYADLLTNFGPPDAHENGYLENLRLFSSKRCAMWIDATVAASYLSNPLNSQVSKDLGFTRAPISLHTKNSHWLWTWALAVPRSSSKKSLAKDFITWATSQEYIQLVGKEKGWLSVPPGTRYSTYKTPAYNEASPFGAFVKEQIDTALVPGDKDEFNRPRRAPQFVSIPEYTALGTSVGINMSLILQKRLTVDQALEQSQTEAKRIMKQYEKSTSVSGR